jgi:ATP-binding cassette, subfamily C, bacterial CydC
VNGGRAGPDGTLQQGPDIAEPDIAGQTYQEQGRKRGTFWRLLGFAVPLWRWIALSVLLGAATVASGVGLLAASAWIIATAALQPSIAVLEVAIVSVRFFGITRGVFRYLERLVSHEVTFRLLARFRVWFYTRLEPLAPAVLSRYRSGDLLARVTADVGALEHFYVRVLAPPLVALVVGLGMYVFFGSYAPGLALVLILGLTVAGAGVPVATRLLSRRTARDLVTARGALDAILVDGIQGLPDLLAFDQGPAQLAQAAELSQGLGHLQERMAAIRGLHGALGSLLTSLTVLAILALAIPMVRAARLTGVDLAVLALATAASFEAVLPLPLAAQYLESSLEAARRLFAVVDTPPAVPSDPAGSNPEAAAGIPAETRETDRPGTVLQVRDLSFSYQAGGPPALAGLSFDLARGASVGIVGPSGAGKSTLVNLLLRFWEYPTGSILLNGRELRSYGGEQVRRQIGVVAQHTYLFNGSVRDNLWLARPEAGEAEIEAAARVAEIHDFIMGLPDGYNTRIGEQGLRLSGGERQRLAIARAVLKDAPFLILDEATASLDLLTERAVLHALRRLMAGRTTLIITHSLAGLEVVDDILVLNEGRIAERGRPIALLARDGLYRRMWGLQTQAALLEEI